MDGGNDLNTLFRYASEYRFGEFDELFSRLPAAAQGQACALRMQIRLFSADEALAGDLERAEQLGAPPRFPCLNGVWLPDTPNRFVAFSGAPGALGRFVGLLPRVADAMARWYGDVGILMVRQVHSEVLYYLGDFVGALALTQAPAGGAGRPMDMILALYVQFRCHLATASAPEAERCMLEMIRLAQTYPECDGPYQVVRDWANLTTGWGGETPRFQNARQGEAQPVMEDRLAAIRSGIAQLSPLEEAFVAYAAQGGDGVCSVRQHYMDIFSALYWLYAGERRQMAAYFERAYRVSAASGLVMPFAEYGRQIIPLLQGAGADDLCDDRKWAVRVEELAKRYEEGLGAYRS